MMDRRASPLSDREVLSGDEEKAITSTSTRRERDSKVNNSTRTHANGSSSRTSHTPAILAVSVDPYFHFRDDDGVVRYHPSFARERSRSPYRRGRSRSRSPYRAAKPGSGEKRRRDDDHYLKGSDPRRHKKHYEDHGATGHFKDRSHGDLDRPQPPKARLSYEDTARPRGYSGRDRDRSRSPFRRSKLDTSPDERRNKNARPGTAGSDYSERTTSAQSVTQRESTPEASNAKDDAKLKISLAQHAQKSTGGAAGSTAGEPAEEKQQELSEAEIIEQRRKRREAIKARHGKSQAPLLVQALEQNMQSAPATPAHEDSGATSEQQSPPSSLNSPSTPQRDSPPASPAAFTVNDDEELANRHQGNTVMHEDDGPSAADYDPNMDLQEDRPDHKRSGVEAPMLDAVEVAENQAPAKASKEFDMFADDDDEDMFAPADTAAKAPTTGVTKAAKALDQSLLDNWDYPDGHYRIILGELLNGRYAVQQQVGKGTFATVVRALDNQTGTPVAIKIAANNETMYKAGQKEMDFLAILNQNDVEDKKHIIRLLRHFDHKGHMCIVFEALSADLREVLKKFGRNVGLNLKAIRSYAQQMFLALGHMKKCNILHADLKPDNILVSEKRNLLKVCDLGTAAFADDAEITPYLVSRFYRAPEVILGMPFDYAIDMWSIGCTLFELYTGRILFAGVENNQMLRVIQECRGKFPIRMLKRSTLAEKHFDLDGNFFSQERDKITGKAVVRQITFRDRGIEGKDLRARLAGNAKGLAPVELKEHATFVDLLEKCLQVDPARRITPADAMRHAFVSHGAELSKDSAKPKVVPAMGGIMPKKR